MKTNYKLFFKILLCTFLIGNLFAFSVVTNMDKYNSLIKPFQIPNIIFPIVWTILFILMSISFYLITQKVDDKKYIYIYLAQLIVNSLWTLIFFGLGKYLFAFIWLIVLIILIIIMMIKYYPINKISFILLIPYLVWVIFAGYLNYMIYILN